MIKKVPRIDFLVSKILGLVQGHLGGSRQVLNLRGLNGLKALRK
jgi:hypothetical protein